MRKIDELHLINLANNLIGQWHGMSIDALKILCNPQEFSGQACAFLDEELCEYLPETLGRIAAFGIHKGVNPGNHTTDYRSIAMEDCCPGPLPYSLGSGFDDVKNLAEIVLAAAMYEILATEEYICVARVAPHSSRYKPLPKLIEFVKKVRLSKEQIEMDATPFLENHFLNQLSKLLG